MNPLRTTFDSLSSRNLRLFFGGQTVSVVGNWLQKAAQAWLVLELTGSGVLLGVVVALQQLPTLVFGLWGGLFADRFDKRRILLVTQTLAMLPAIALGTLTATGVIELWMILIVAVLLGTVEAFERPARHTFVVELVDSAKLTNAITLNSIVLNCGKIGGPALAGLLIVWVGVPLTFFLNAVSFLSVIAGLLLMRTDQIQRAEPAPRARGQVLEGLRYVRDTPVLLGPLLLMTVTGMLVYEFQVTVPLLAHDSYANDARIFGIMFSAMGVGAVLGGLALAGTLRPTIRALTLSGLALAVMLLLTAASGRVLTLTLAALLVMGACSIAFRVVANSYLQLTAVPAMRGRVMSLLVIATIGTSPISAPLIGWVGDLLGGRATFAVGGVGTALATSVTYLYLRRHRRGPVPRPGPSPLPLVSPEGASSR